MKASAMLLSATILSLLPACTLSPRDMSQTLFFDPRYSFDVFTEFYLEQSFPFHPGQTLSVPVLFIPHPINDFVRQEISPGIIWYASVYPYGLPDPTDPYQETLLIDLAAIDSSEQSWQFAWRVDHNDFLISFLKDEADLKHLPLVADGSQDQGFLPMEVLSLEKLERDEEKGVDLWRMILIPYGESEENSILSTVSWVPKE